MTQGLVMQSFILLIWQHHARTRIVRPVLFMHTNRLENTAAVTLYGQQLYSASYIHTAYNNVVVQTVSLQHTLHDILCVYII